MFITASSHRELVMLLMALNSLNGIKSSVSLSISCQSTALTTIYINQAFI